MIDWPDPKSRSRCILAILNGYNLQILGENMQRVDLRLLSGLQYWMTFQQRNISITPFTTTDERFIARR